MKTLSINNKLNSNLSFSEMVEIVSRAHQDISDVRSEMLVIISEYENMKNQFEEKINELSDRISALENIKK